MAQELTRNSVPTMGNTLRSALCAGLAVAASPSLAGMVDSDACRRDVAAARAAYARSQADLGSLGDGRREICAAWRAHKTKLVDASRVYKRCLTGTDRRVESGRMDAMTADFDDAIGRSCAAE
jgi:hypothetical protein